MGIPYINCTKLTPTESQTADLITVKSYSTSTIKGYLGSGSNNRVEVSGKETIEVLHKFYTNDFTINSFDKIKYNGQTFEIISIPRNTANRNHHIKLSVRMIENIKQE